MDHLGTKILVDGGDPRETEQVKERLGFVDGQTTNPSLIAKNPRIQQRLAAGHKLTQSEELNAYRDVADEARGLGEDEPPGQRNAAGFGYRACPVKVLGKVLVQLSQKRGIGVAAKLESALESIVHFMSGRSAAW